MSSALSHLFVTTADLAESRRFWTTLGLGVLVDEGGYMRIGGDGGFHIGLEQVDDPGPSGVGPAPPSETADRAGHGPSTGRPELEVVVAVDDVTSTCQALRAAGFPVVHGPIRTEWGTLHAWTRDPDGRSVSFQQPLDEG